jgi:protein-S-isoprenylcysteine O-methyltransferase Ste14
VVDKPVDDRYAAGVRPLVLHDGPWRAAFSASLGLWAIVDVAVRWRTRRQGRSPAEWTFFFIVLVMSASAVGAAIAVGNHVAPIPGPAWLPPAIGLPLLWAGAALRSWAIHTLGGLFKLVVVIQRDHRVVDRGPYRWVRHPSYTGAILGCAGIGLAEGDWVSLGALLVGSLVAFVVRIRVEERALLDALGEEYAAYVERTARLVPGVY